MPRKRGRGGRLTSRGRGRGRPRGRGRGRGGWNIGTRDTTQPTAQSPTTPEEEEEDEDEEEEVEEEEDIVVKPKGTRGGNMRNRGRGYYLPKYN
jgi:hypothetical protein